MTPIDREYFTLATPYFTIEGRSRAGHETYFRIKELGLALDIGRCPDLLLSVPHVLVTHAHLDHAAGIAFYSGQRHLQGLGGGKVYVPQESADDFRELMKIHERLEGMRHEMEIVGMAEGAVVRLGRTHEVRAHRSTHRVPARAWEVIEVRHHLKPEFSGRDGAEIAQLRRDGVAIDEPFRVPLLFYTGDTDRGILEQNDALWHARVLMIECSFIADDHADRAPKYRHIHFDDLAEFAERFENELIVLTHFSRRYTHEEIRSGIARRCPARIRDRIRLALPAPFQSLG
jgi:ribonuclease Z